MPEIWEKNRSYTVLRSYVDLNTRRSYSSYKVEDVPVKDGRAVILVANHTNTLLDALVVLDAYPDTCVFGARADVFKKPAIARIMRFLRIVPIARIRDGLRNVAQNLDVINEVHGVLSNGAAFCLFPEGRHRPMHSLLPIQKGVARIAVEHAVMEPTCIIPVGIEYSDFFHYRGKCRVRFGKPIDVNAIVDSGDGANQSDVYDRIREEISDGLKGLITYIPDDENYEKRVAELLPPPPKHWWKWPLAILTLPFFLLAAVLALPLWGVAEWIAHFKIKDSAFRNTVRFGVRLVGIPLFFIIWAVLGFVFLHPLLAAGLLVWYLMSYDIFYDWLNLVNGRF